VLEFRCGAGVDFFAFDAAKSNPGDDEGRGLLKLLLLLLLRGLELNVDLLLLLEGRLLEKLDRPDDEYDFFPLPYVAASESPEAESNATTQMRTNEEKRKIFNSERRTLSMGVFAWHKKSPVFFAVRYPTLLIYSPGIFGTPSAFGAAAGCAMDFGFTTTANFS
jgi:hypothetical protein